MGTGFSNSWTAGEISDDAWDRVDIQPIEKGCEEATNLVIRIAGPLAKRRGFWRLGAVADQTKAARMIPFRRSIDDALMLEFGDLTVRVWSADGSPLLSGMTQVQFASPYAEADLANLRFKQVVDVIYLRTADGQVPRTLERIDNATWQFNVESFPNGPWRPENADKSQTLTIASLVSGTAEQDSQFADTGAGSILPGAVVDLTAAAAFFDPGMVGASVRLRAGDGTASAAGWIAGSSNFLGAYVLSVGRVYVQTSGTVANSPHISNPPVQLSGSQSDGVQTWLYRHDGAGVLQITAVADATHATATVLATVPLYTGQSTSNFAESAYSDYRGWPRAWPEIVEERLVEGATASNLDFIDLTGTADFRPASETFSPGLGTGAVIDVDALRRRLGEDGAEMLWARVSTFLVVGTASGEHVVSGGLFGAALAPSTIVCRQISDFGSEDVYPAKAHKGLFFVTRGGQTLRVIRLDLQQTDSGDDLTVLARHIAERTFKQLAWIPQPDETLWARLGDGGLAAMTSHLEQQVQGWTRQQLPGGWIAEDIVALPGPGRFETLWLVASRTKGGATQRVLAMQSQVADGLFMDFADEYEGAPVSTITGLDHFDGETVRVLANGVQIPDQVVVGGAVAVTAGTTAALVGLGYPIRFKSLKLASARDGAVNTRQRATGAIVTLKTVTAEALIDGQARGERIDTRLASDIPGPTPRRKSQDVNLPGDASRDPRIVITEDSAYDFVLYSLRPKVTGGA